MPDQRASAADKAGNYLSQTNSSDFCRVWIPSYAKNNPKSPPSIVSLKLNDTMKPLVSVKGRRGVVGLGDWREQGSDGEAASSRVRGWLLERKDAVAVRLFANKLALVMVPPKLF